MDPAHGRDGTHPRLDALDDAPRRRAGSHALARHRHADLEFRGCGNHTDIPLDDQRSPRRAEIKCRGARPSDPTHRSISPHTGVQPEKHTIGSQKLVGDEVEDITFSKIQKVLEVFDDQVTFLKQQYVQTIEKRDDFLDVGFLLTDYASDFYDGKQITLCVYI